MSEFETQKLKLTDESQQNSCKIIAICGGVMSSLGKGITTSSLGLLLQRAGFRISVMKIDPYLNIDAGTMSPYEHGEVFVLSDGSEVDLDLGNYERFLNIKLGKEHSLTSGKVFHQILEEERKGVYLGKTVQIIPHVTNEIIKRINIACEKQVESNGLPQILLIEIGGTVGDLESGYFYEAFRQLIMLKGKENVLLGLLTHIPEIGKSKEQKTKASQNAIKDLRSTGLFPDFIVCRSENEMTIKAKQKLAMYASLNSDCILSNWNVKTILQVPIILKNQNVVELICKKFNLNNWKIPELNFLNQYIEKQEDLKNADSKRICIVGKYNELEDSYISLLQALEHAAIQANINLNIDWVEAELLENCNIIILLVFQESEEQQKLIVKLKTCSGILIPGGFGTRGIEGKIQAAKIARTLKIPYLGLCLGFQIAVIEFSRNLMNIQNAHTQEVVQNESEYTLVIIYIPEDTQNLGGTMQLGSKETIITDPNSLAYSLYHSHLICERHRHRYEVNPDYVQLLQTNGLKFSGYTLTKKTSSVQQRMTILELPQTEHPFFIACQFHPEFQTRVECPNPMLQGFLNSVKEKIKN